MDNTCCFIDEKEQAAAAEGEFVPGCQNVAKWRIESGPGPDDYTESCTDHVGAMLTDAPEHRIYPTEYQ